MAHRRRLCPPPSPQCSKALPGCERCASATRCTKCEERKWPGLGLVGGVCRACGDLNCARCDGNPRRCQACINDGKCVPHVLNPVTGTCRPGLPRPDPRKVAAAIRRRNRATRGPRPPVRG